MYNFHRQVEDNVFAIKFGFTNRSKRNNSPTSIPSDTHSHLHSNKAPYFEKRFTSHDIPFVSFPHSTSDTSGMFRNVKHETSDSFSARGYDIVGAAKCYSEQSVRNLKRRLLGRG
jgi:hypothetical protein